MKKLTLEQRISQFNTKHNGIYDYSLVPDGILWNSKIDIICREHGVFSQSVNNHMRGAGCPFCSHSMRKTKSDRVKQARSVHGDKYDYSLWPDDVKAHEIVTTICKIHGKWEHYLSNHILKGSACPQCSNRTKKSHEYWLYKFKKVHGDRYSYRFESNLISGRDHVTVTCKEHGEFSQSAYNHSQGKGCSGCMTNGFDPMKNGFVYILQSDDKFKVGITNNLQERVGKLRRSTPFDFEVAHTEFYEVGAKARERESLIMSNTDSANLRGFDGATEWRKGVWSDQDIAQRAE